MGGGQSNLSPEDSAVLTGLLKDEYAVLQREGYSEAQIQEKLAEKYNEIISSMAIKVSPPGSRSNSRPRSAGSDGGDGETYEERRVGSPSTNPYQRRTLHGNDRVSDDEDVVAMLQAAREGREDDVERCLNRSSRRDLNIIDYTSSNDENRQTALMLGCEYGHTRVVSLLIDMEADMEMRDKNGETAMHYCTSNGHLDVVKIMVKRGGNIEAKNYNGYNPLMMAADFNHLEIVRYLLFNGADLDARNHRGCSALVYAADNGNLDVAEYLIKQGSDIEVRSNIGFTPLIYACQRGHLEMATLLADCGAVRGRCVAVCCGVWFLFGAVVCRDCLRLYARADRKYLARSP